ncbi:MAG: DUF2716 domain-containing protein [Butyrivibrio sp.]|nr:DUF2716 domain-containing protein [Butyrivibrio sp.]
MRRKCIFSNILPGCRLLLFISTDWKYGLFGHPWRKEIVVMGKELIRKLDLHMDELNIRSVDTGGMNDKNII